MNAAQQSMLDQLEVIKAEGQAVAAGLTDTQFNWQPDPDRWSIAQCLNHLNVGDALVLPAFDRAIAEGRAQGKLSAGPFQYGWFSRLAIASMEPPPRWRMRTPMRGSAGTTHRAADVLPEFARVHDQLAERVRRADGLDLARVRTISPVNRLVRLPLGAYFQFILAHDRRHLWQARNVRNAPGFGVAQPGAGGSGGPWAT
ncbi:MAG TPA: DinB family protein [Gemmatimonadales bacterium]|nr:DinB family protein [Gemmatimonadales bacterium]